VEKRPQETKGTAYGRDGPRFLAPPIAGFHKRPHSLRGIPGGGAAWWFRGSVDQGETRGLRAQIDGLREQINALEQRLKLASEQEQAATKAAKSANEEIATLKEEIEAARVPIKEMSGRIAGIVEHMREFGKAQEKVRETLQPFKILTPGANPLGPGEWRITGTHKTSAE
jgi:DNA repair exonuclease SbcCD ATPase subunit